MVRYLGIKDINTNKYKWEIKSPIDNKFWKNSLIYINNGFIFNKILILNDENNIYLKFIPKRNLKLNVIYLTILNYKENNPVNIFNDLYGKDNDILYPLGIHFEDAILKFYKNKNLSLGFVKKILR